MIKKTFLFIILSFIFFNTANAAKKITYLKCPLMMVENKGKSYPDSWWPKGAQLNEFYVKIIESKKVKVSIHKYFTAKNFKEDQKPWDGDGALKNLVFSREGEKINWTYSDTFKAKNVNGKISDSYTFKNISGNWKLTIFEFSEYTYPDKSSQDIHIKHKLSGDCLEVDKKSYKKLIKTGKI